MNRVLRYFVTALIVSLGAVIGSARAQGGYGLYILGKEVTPANCGDLSTLDTERIKVQSGGEFKYDPASNTLFMKGVTIAGEEERGQIENKGLENLTIDFAAENVLKSVNRIGIVLRKVTTFRGNGELRVETTNEVGIYLHENVSLTISAITVTVSAGSYGIKGHRGEASEQLIIKNATVVVNRSEFAAIHRLHSLGMEGVQIIEPVGGKWIPELHSIMEGNEKAKRVKIAPWVAVTGVTLDKETLLEFTMGDAGQTLTATVLPDKATNKKVTWTSSDTKVATVKDGTVTPVGVGEAKITVTTEDEGKTAECTVTVNPVKVTGVTLDKTTLEFTMGDAGQTLTATVLPDKATNKKVTWTSSDTKVATVKDGTVTPVGVGEAKITVTTEDEGKTAECTVTVNPVKVTGVTLDKTTLEFTMGDAGQTLTATVLPDKATNKKVTWTSSDTKVATVKDGTVTPVGVGEAKITVTTEDEGKTAECTVTVKAKPTPTPSPTPKPTPTPTPKPKPNAVEDAALATVLVSPNPFTSQLRIVNPEGASVTYELVDLAGGVLRTGVLDGTETVVETADLVAGLYFVRFMGENGAQRGVRVVKH